MKWKGGYDVGLSGRPAAEVAVLPEPDALHLPLASRRFRFTDICVEEGRRVEPGHVLARDPRSYSVPLLAPRAGTVRLATHPGHITLEDVAREPEEPYHPHEDLAHVPAGLGSAGIKRCKLVELGAWQFLFDAHTGALPDPFGAPRAVIVSSFDCEPFVARGSVQLRKRLSAFTRGLEQLQSLLEYQPIHFVLPHIQSALGDRVRQAVRGYAWVKPVLVPLRYGLDHFAVLARSLGLKANPSEPVWSLSIAGVLAVDRALTLSRPSTVRIVSIGGPGATSPAHLKAMAGYPLDDLLKLHVADGPMRVLSGGILTGESLDDARKGLDAECNGLTVLPEHAEREFLGFVRPGGDRRSYSDCFLSALRGPFTEPLTTALRGELRPCVSCGFCEEVCPARIMPHLIHRCLYRDDLEEAERARVDLCVKCGLCAYVCPSKIELRSEMMTAQTRIAQELHVEEAPA